MQKAAIYARYSTEEQRATSVEDQVRRAREKAESLGFQVPDELIFSDASITGTAKGLAKRVGYERLLKAWDHKEFEALIIDEVSRLARDPIELAKIQVRIEKSKVRLIATDGLDSAQQSWQLQYGFNGVMASHFIRETAHRVVRGMIGQLERGYAIAAPPFGYLAIRENEDGTKWIIDETKASYVREIYQQKLKGASLIAIAKHLNERGIPSPRKSKKGGVRYWRPGTVRQLLRNTIYRGLFVWNGSPFSKAKEKRGEATLEPIDYPRPELRLVDDETWFACNQSSGGCIIRGGDKHVFSGLISCAVCGGKLTVSTGGSSHSLYCAQCAQAKRAGVPERSANYVSSNGVQAMLIYALEKTFSEEAKEAFRERLKIRLEGGQEERIAMLKSRISQKERSVKQLLRLLSSSETEDPAVDEEYRAVLSEKRRLIAELTQLEAAMSQVDKAAIEQQLQVNPLSLIPGLFSKEVPAQEARAALRRLFPRIVYESKPSRFCTTFSIELAPGVALAEASKTKVMDDESVILKLRVTGGAMRPSTWVVEEIE
ncbi:MAG TPA: recombinase family protein [Herbaspirillum sp.]|jgi:DNA invertase Pin-like site-specific DNA recombinase